MCSTLFLSFLLQCGIVSSCKKTSSACVCYFAPVNHPPNQPRYTSLFHKNNSDIFYSVWSLHYHPQFYTIKQASANIFGKSKRKHRIKFNSLSYHSHIQFCAEREKDVGKCHCLWFHFFRVDHTFSVSICILPQSRRNISGRSGKKWIKSNKRMRLNQHYVRIIRIHIIEH